MAQEVAFLLAYYLNGVLQGLYYALFIRWAVQNRTRSLYFRLTAWVVFILINIDTAINLYLLICGFWESLPDGGPAAYFATNLNNWPTVWRECNYIALVMICDAFMVHSVWQLWNKNWWIASLPFLLLIAETVTGGLAGAQLWLAVGGPLFEHLVEAFYIISVALQVAITILLGYRLIKPADLRHLPVEQRSRRYRIMRVIFESGFLISLTVIVNLGLFFNGTVYEWVPNIALGHVYAITIILIVLRLRTEVAEAPAGASTESHLQAPSRPVGGRGSRIQSSEERRRALTRTVQPLDLSKVDDADMGDIGKADKGPFLGDISIELGPMDSQTTIANARARYVGDVVLVHQERSFSVV